MAEHNDIGKIGENITVTFLERNNFIIVERNFRTKTGEIDIIAKKDNILRFIEVKSVKVKDFTMTNALRIQPEENLTLSKWQKLITTIKLYLDHKSISQETSYQVDLACVYINTSIKQGKVVLIENVNKEGTY